MNQAQLPYVALYLLSTFLASVSQVLLKKAALREHKSLLAEYTDWRVILGYGLFVGCSLLTMLAYKGVPLNVGPVLEATGYLYVTFFGVPDRAGAAGTDQVPVRRRRRCGCCSPPFRDTSAQARRYSDRLRRSGSFLP